MTDQETLDFVNESLNNKRSNRKEQIGIIVEASDENGNNYNGCLVFLDSFEIRHTFAKHGIEREEANRGQIAVVPNDFVVLKSAIPFITEFENVGTTRRNLELILTKHIGEITYYFTFEIRPKYTNLFFKTMYKRRTRA